MHYPYFDNFTVFLYLFVGTLCMLSIKIARGSRFYSHKKSFEGFALLFIVLILFAVLRKVGLHLGGEDALGYQEDFLNFNNASDRFQNTDILYGITTKFIRSFTSNPYIYRFICYGFIAFGYIIYIKTLSPQGISSIPFICILIPFMRSFGSMRNTMSISFFLLSIVALYNDKTIRCIILVCCSVLMHRLSFVMLAFFPFYFLFKNLITSATKLKLIFFTLGFIVVSYLLAIQLQKFILIFSLFEDNGNADFWYLTNKQGSNILLSWPMYLVHVLLFIALMMRYKSLPNTKQVNFIKIIFIFDIIMMPATLVLGMYRFSEYFYISNLILWGVLITIICEKFIYTSRVLVESTITLGFYGLLYIRLVREWEELAIMPYLFFWQ